MSPSWHQRTIIWCTITWRTITWCRKYMICVHLRWRNENLTHYFMLFPCLAQDLQQQLGGGGKGPNLLIWRHTLSIFFLLTRYQSKISGIGVTPLTSSTVQWHTSITAPPLFEVYNGVECWLHHYLLFFVWPCSLARSCRRCCCRSAAREGELQGRWPSRHAALQGLRPALCCVPRNERLAGFLMWSYF